MRWLTAVCLGWLGGSAALSAQEPAWRYVTGTTAEAPFRPIYRFIPLSEQKPDDLDEEVRYRGKVQRYAQIRYGSDDSRRVVVVLDEVGRDDFDLYVDADRNRVIEPKDKLPGAGKERTGRLAAESTVGTELLEEPRSVRWRPGATRKTIGLATVGYVEGTATIAGKPCAVRRVDGNANGSFADAADRVWIDLDGDRRWDPLGEQFPFAPILTLDGRRYAVRGDTRGTRLAFEPLTSEGRVRLRLASGAAISELDVMLTGEDGSAFVVQALDTPAVVPAGRYAIGSVVLAVPAPAGGPPTRFVFSRVGVDRDTRWHEVKKDQELTLDPVGTLRFGLEIDKEQRVRKPGEAVTVQPQLFTADGLLINSCTAGEADEATRHAPGPRCAVRLVADGGRPLDVQSSGFA